MIEENKKPVEDKQPVENMTLEVKDKKDIDTISVQSGDNAELVFETTKVELKSDE